MRIAAVAAGLLFALGSARVAVGAEGPNVADSFATEVRPILARHCLKCHGPDEKTRKADLRLDLREVATKPTPSGSTAIVPGDPDQSELIARILSDDPIEQMPPPDVKHPLSADQKETLRRWVAAGAPYAEHWAFVAPRQAALPEVREPSWPNNPIDRFVLARLEAEGLAPSPEADRPTLIRRASLDLIGLQPTPDEVDAFVSDPAPDAYERLVDRLLASPRYGERWARRWLDLARYADTNGYEKDRPRSIWPYRDWTIRALNDDMPFDQFTTQQIAGDMLPDAAIGERTATGFHRNTMLNEEGGIDPLEYRYLAMTDRVATTATTWLGLTLGCAQCHTHKFDPIPHDEYFRFMALMDNADEPEIAVASPEVAARRRDLEGQIVAKLAELPARFPLGEGSSLEDQRPEAERHEEAARRNFRDWLAREAAQAVRWTVLTPVEAKTNLPLLTIQPDGSVFASGDQTKSDTYSLAFRDTAPGITALRIEALPDPRLPKNGPGRVYYEGSAGDFFLSEFDVLSAGADVPFERAIGAPATAIDGDPQTGWSIPGGQGREHSAIVVLKAPLAGTTEFDVRLLFERYHAAGLGRFRISATTEPAARIARTMPTEIEALLTIANEARTAEQSDQLFRHYLTIAPELAKEREAIEALRKALPTDPTTLIMQERPPENPRPTLTRERGEYLRPGKPIEPGVLSILHPLPADAPRNRLGLARWLVSRENPLVGRVTMNRQWSAFFGRGLVRTTQDFGYQGELPSHPELLDWLAVEFANQGWSLKRMNRLIATSATYRQSSRMTPQGQSRDPENRLLARGPRVRLEAEAVRDSVLVAAGLLSGKIGGPSVFPPQPPGVAAEGVFGPTGWVVSQGEDRYRRGLYTFSKRTAPFAMLAAFDAPSGETCIAGREATNTPIQALTMLNDLTLVEAAQALGRRMAAEDGPVDRRIEMLFRRCLVRSPDRDEMGMLVEFYEAQRRAFGAKATEAAAVAGPGEGDVAARAAWTALSRALFNLDEMITKG